jgi:hypothetical protein
VRGIYEKGGSMSRKIDTRYDSDLLIGSGVNKARSFNRQAETIAGRDFAPKSG